MGTRFVGTHECDAHEDNKMAYISSEEKDIQLVKGPVGLPGRAIRNNLIIALESGNVPIRRCYSCLTPCDVKTSPYCISKALIDAVNGDVENGLIFCGSNAFKMKEIVSVKDLNERVSCRN